MTSQAPAVGRLNPANQGALISPRFTHLTVVFVLAGVLLVAAANATAATRFAAPNGTGIDPCENPANPCTIFTAADQASSAEPGDEVVLAPGEYSDTAGDLGPGFVSLEPGIRLHGADGQPRPVIRLNEDVGAPALTVNENDTVAHLEIVSAVADTDISVTGGVVEDLIARSSADGPGSTTCTQTGGLIRNSACLNSGDGAAALGGTVSTAAALTTRLRNVTAVAEGAVSFGLRYRVTGPGSLDVDAKAVIAGGRLRDVFAAGLSQPPGTGAQVRVVLDHSSYANVETAIDAGQGTASVTEPGTATNILEPPFLAPDGYHQLPGSPTLNVGATDGFSGATDIDGQPRASGIADIGADERVGIATVTDLSCTPAALMVGGPATVCTATVVGDPAAPAPPGETISFSSSRAGLFGGGGGCVLVAVTASGSACTVTYAPNQDAVGTHQLHAAYLGDGLHDGSDGGAAISATSPAPPPTAPPTVPPTVGKPPLVLPQTRLGKRPRAQSSKRMAVFTFSTDQASSGFECKLDKKPFKRCASPFKAPVKPGRHTFRVRAVSIAGNADPTPAASSWTVSRAPR